MKSLPTAERRGVILLVVISALAFFSILIATYLVFSKDARQSSYVLASRGYRAPEVKDLLDEALMTLVRGTSDESSPFYGEDLLSDLYGRRGGHDVFVANENIVPDTFRHIGGGYVRFPVRWPATRPIPDVWDQRRDDLFAGRLITFTEGPLANRTFRVIRSGVDPQSGVAPLVDVFYIRLPDDVLPAGVLTNPDQNVVTAALRPLFFENLAPPLTGVGIDGYPFHMNGIPRNSPGIGFRGATGNSDQLVDPLLPMLTGGSFPPMTRMGLPNIPVALQPNKIRRPGGGFFDAYEKLQFEGDFNEDYDAADFNNWFLSYTNPDGSVVPSFHRPAVINYLLNGVDWDTASQETFSQALASISRATFRPLPIAAGDFGNPIAINPLFTGGSSKYALRAPLPMQAATDVQRRMRLDQLARALIRDGVDFRDQWDIDNSGDGIKDSVWIDIDLPTFTSPEGKLLKPLIATRIEDLSARLNVNAHDNASLANDLAALDSELANWAGTRRAFATAGIGMAGNTRPVFRGLGYGPAEIQIPAVSANLPVVTPVMANQLRSLVVDRYRSNYGVQVPGRPGADFLDTLLHGWRPAIFTAGSGYGASIDPFGRGGVALGRDGNLVAAVSGRPIATGTTPPADSIDEAVNDPYESDPTGRFGGDSLYSFGELEALLRSNDFDVEMLPQRLRTRLLDLIQAHPEFANLFTTISKSDDSPVVSGGSDGLTSFRSTQRFLSALIASRGGGGLNNRQMGQLIAPELRLGRKLDVNRPFGNGVDDSPAAPNNGFGAIDEPREIAPGVLLPTTAGNALPNVGVATATVAGVFAAGPYEARAFSVLPTSGQTIPAAFDNPPPPFNIPAPRYNIMDRVDESVFDPNNPAFIHPFDIERDLNDGPLGRQVTARQLLARHIYVLLMALTRDYTFPSMAETFNTVPPRTTAATFNADVFKARRLAQWAVNLVDYRDPDAIMTRFVFDPTPFDGWSPPAEPAPPEFVVWGVEAPELIFSESLAFHDVRVRDIEEDTGTQKRKDDAVDPDPNTDQIRKPEGSLFLELYCPRSQVIGAPEQTTKLGVPRELYNIDLPTGVAELDLIRSAPPRPGVNQGVPVWRIAISERHDAASPKAAANPQLLRTANPDGFSPEVDHPDELSPAPPVADRLAYDRFIWFRDFRDEVEVADLITDNDIRSSGGVQMLPHQVFFAPSQDLRDAQPINPMRQLQPGQYLSLAPRVITRLGSRSPGAAYPGEPSDQRFEAFSGDGVVQFNHNDERVTPLLNPTGLYTAALPMVIGAFRPAGWDVDQFEDGYIGLNVSEPLANSYYPQPQFNLDATGNYPLVDSYIDYAAIANTARDIPADIDPALGYNRVPTPDGIEPALGTTPQYCTAFVERLADPTVPYDPLFNPYRVVDWISIDLNVFSGEELETKVVAAAARYAARSRQKNGFIGNVRANALFSNETNRPEDELADVAPVATGDFFALSSTGNHVYSSLSFLNTTTAEPGAATPATGSSNPVGLSVPPFTAFTASIGSEGAPEVLGNDRNLPGGPLDPAAGFGPGEPFTFARHNWLNRPFATHFELMMVPASSAGRLFEEFSVNVAGTNPEIYPTATSLNPAVAFYAPFRHLLNFFHSDRTLPSPPAAGAELAGLFDMVHTLPRFKGEVGLRQPRAMNLLGTNPPAPGNDPFFRSAMRPPLNIDYDNQRLAQVNLNTVSDFNVWVGVMQGHLNASEFNTVPGGANADQLSFQSFLATRRGYGVPQPVTPPVPTTGIGNGPINYDPENLSHRYPSQFVGMMRNHVWSSQFPTLRNDAGFDAQSVARRRGVNGTLLRVAGVLESSDPAVVANPHGAQFVRSAGQIPDATLSGDPQMNRDRDAFLRYQTLMRMPNLVSNNSQIYLIRTTMGFFEVDADSGNLGREYNEELGQNQRYRAMYIIDRSKEVGFEPGENLNARDVVLFESYAQ